MSAEIRNQKFMFMLFFFPDSTLKLEDDKRATTNVQNGWVFFSLFSFILLRNGLILRESPGGKSVKSVDKCEKVPKRFCPLVVAL